MNNDRNTALIQELYAKFQRGDIEGVLAAVADDVVWEQPDNPVIPYAGRRKGKAAVREFFAAVGKVEIERFEPREYVASGDRVLAIGEWSGRVRATGKRFVSAWVMAWSVVNGRVTQFRAYEDTAAVAAACK